jgi:hypothetical protein
MDNILATRLAKLTSGLRDDQLFNILWKEEPEWNFYHWSYILYGKKMAEIIINSGVKSKEELLTKCVVTTDGTAYKLLLKDN